MAAGHEEVDPAGAAAAFSREFSTRYGDTRPRWVHTGWQEAARQAHAEFKFLFVYLHAPNHQARASAAAGEGRSAVLGAHSGCSKEHSTVTWRLWVHGPMAGACMCSAP